MPEIKISIGGREFQVACQEGEEHFLRSAAGLLATEADTLVSQIGKLPEARMLLMAGLMLADKTAGLDERLKEAERKAATQEAKIAELEARKGGGEPVEVKVEVPVEVPVEVAVVPPQLIESMAEIAARAEGLAEALEAAKP
ncbi:cell division protein ZapA [Pseudoruegeria sp. SHC-113]|uniref:cell division protein ZapA n=1 Tax=Pseudoruegeria sp. SHC-113 TaxID=2855439 RepID=UPI0021BA84E5|nr:cell division protein ZapA [Pseudoruegeria sp. SHC-113]MCT8160617.1 cell division protein ZapA [Pseudoruegeria sp. SHC-113]